MAIIRRSGPRFVTDSIVEAIDRSESRPFPALGIPTRTVTSNYQARFGDMVRYDATAGPFSIFLPSADRAQVSKMVCIKNVGATTKTVTVHPTANATIDGELSFSMAASKRFEIFVYAGNGEWLTATPDVTGAGGAASNVFFEWDDTDAALSQFDAKVDGAQVSSSTVSFVSFAGLNWVSIAITASGSGSTVANTMTLLPISALPPSANYAVSAEWLCTASSNSNQVGAIVAVRYVTGPTFYGVRYVADTTTFQVLDKMVSGTRSQLGPAMSDPTLVVPGNTGMRFGIEVEGSSLLKANFGEVLTATDTSSPITAAGKLAIGCTTSGTASVSVTNLFRNIRAWSL